MKKQEVIGQCTTPDGVTRDIINVVATKRMHDNETHIFLLDDHSIALQTANVADPEKPLTQGIHLQLPEFAILFMGMHQCVEKFGIDIEKIIETLAGKMPVSEKQE